MGRGLDGYFLVVPVVGGLCSFEGPRESAPAERRGFPRALRPSVLTSFRWL
jgi:hypothetical protein